MHGLMMDYPLTLTSILERARRVFGEREIVSRLEDGSLHRSDYAAVHARVRRLMSVLAKLGVAPTDRVGTLAWNSHRHLELYFGIPCSGAVLHTINVRLQPAQLTYIVRHAGTQVLFVDRCLVDVLKPVLGELEQVRHVVVMDDEGRGAAAGLDGALDYETLLAEASEETDFPELDERQAAGLCYTSGTTGEPKGVLYSHRSYYLHSLGSMGMDSMRVSQQDAVMPVVPMFHANAWGFPFTATFAGAKQVMPGRHLTGAALAELIETERVSLTAGVPTVWNLVLAHLRKHPRDIRSLHTMIVGGSAAPLALLRAWKEEQGVTITHAWGMTETSPVGCCSRLRTPTLAEPEDAQLLARKKQGIPVPGVEVKIEGDGGEELPADGEAVGELCVRGPWVAREYFGSDDRSAFGDDGWFHTGDVASIDPLGYVEITDRKKDLIKSRGEWISSVDMENAAMGFAGVAEAAVTAKPDELRDEVPVLWIVPEDGATVDVDALIAYLAETFAKWQLPRRENVLTIDAIPKTSVGKFDKKVLRARDTEPGSSRHQQQ